MFMPWKGKVWGEAGNTVADIRLLILGESHYKPRKPELVDRCLPNETNDVLEEYLSGEGYRFFTGITQVVQGQLKSQLTKEQIREVWDSLVFYNYVPVFAATGPRKRPTNEMFAAGKEPFASLCAELQPEAILICGFRLNEVLWREFATGPREKAGGSPFYEIHGAVATYIQHPSSGFSSTAWRFRVIELLGRVVQARRTTVHDDAGWSKELKAQTRDLIEGHDIFVSRDGRLHLKHANSTRGTILEEDLARGVLRVVEDGTGTVTTFASTDELVAAGWVID